MLESLSKNSRVIYLKANVLIVVNIIVAGIFGFMWFNFLWAPWIGSAALPWSVSLNPLADFFFLRSGGPILYANHVSSALSVMTTATYFVFKTKKVVSSIFAVFATVSIHELVLDVIMGPLSNWAGLLNITAGTSVSFFTLNFRWLFWLSLFLVGGVVLASKQQKQTLVKITAVCLMYSSVWMVFLAVSGHDYWTLHAFTPGPMIVDPIDNFLEVMGWMLPVSLWWFSWL